LASARIERGDFIPDRRVDLVPEGQLAKLKKTGASAGRFALDCRYPAMTIETVTGTLLGSVLSSDAARGLFTLIANSRIAEKSALKASNPNPDAELAALVAADLISSAPNGEKYYVTAKGLKVARDLEKILFFRQSKTA
jgi:hypothetical protein